MAITFQDLEEISTTYRRQIGMPNMRDITIPHMSAPEKSRAFAPELISRLGAALTTLLTEEERDEEPIPREEFPRIAVTGTSDECQEYFQGGADWEALFSKSPPGRFTNGQA